MPKNEYNLNESTNKTELKPDETKNCIWTNIFESDKYLSRSNIPEECIIYNAKGLQEEQKKRESKNRLN